MYLILHDGLVPTCSMCQYSTGWIARYIRWDKAYQQATELPQLPPDLRADPATVLRWMDWIDDLTAAPGMARVYLSALRERRTDRFEEHVRRSFRSRLASENALRLTAKALLRTTIRSTADEQRALQLAVTFAEILDELGSAHGPAQPTHLHAYPWSIMLTAAIARSLDVRPEVAEDFWAFELANHSNYLTLEKPHP